MEFEKRTFALKDLDEKFWEKVVLIQKWSSTGLEGWGCLWIVTADKKLFCIGFKDFPYNENNLAEFSDIFKYKDTIKDLDDLYHPYEVEGKGWRYRHEGKIFVRENFYNAFISKYKEVTFKHKDLCVIHIAGLALGGKLERYDLEKTGKTIKQKRGNFHE